MNQQTIGKLLKGLYVFCISLFIYFIYNYDLNYFNRKADALVQYYNKKDSLISAQIEGIPDSVLQIKKLKTEYKIIQQIKEPYLPIAQMYGSNGYAFTVLFAITSILAGVLGFLIAKKGWDNTSNFYIKAGFLIVFFFSTLSGVVQAVSNTKENTQKNMERYYYYNGLQIEIYDYLVDNQGFLGRKEYNKIDSFLSATNKAIKNNPDIYFDIDIDKVPKSIKPLE